MTRAAVLALAIALLAASPAEAQTTFQDATGIPWSVASLEVGLLATAVAIAGSGRESAPSAGLVMLGLTAVGAGVAAGVAQATDAPVEPPMVFHHAFVAAALLGGTISFALTEAGETGDTRLALGIAGLIAGAGAMATYSVLRMDRLAHDPELVEEAHVLSWVPIVTAGLVGGVLTGLFQEVGALIGAITGLVALGVSIAFVEVAIAENPTPMAPMPLVSGGAFRF